MLQLALQALARLLGAAMRLVGPGVQLGRGLALLLNLGQHRLHAPLLTREERGRALGDLLVQAQAPGDGQGVGAPGQPNGEMIGR